MFYIKYYYNLSVLTTKDIVDNSSSRTYTIYIAKLKIGDYVKYEPDNNNSTYNLKATYSGYTSDQTIDNSYDPQLWRIMELDTNGNITKLFGVPIRNQTGVVLKGSIGYNNGVYLLNYICKSRYGNVSLGATARNLNIEDIEARMNATGIAARNANKGHNNQSIQYGTTKTLTGSNAKYPAIYAQEKYSGVDVSDVTAGSQVIAGEVNATAQARMNPNGKSGSDDIYTTLPETSETTGPSKTNLTCTQTYYRFESTPSSYFDDTNFHSMIFGTGTYFWLASRYVNCNSSDSNADFGLRYIDGGHLSANNLFNSYGDYDYYDRLAPVVSLNSGIQVKNGSGTTSDPYEIGK